MFNQSELDRGLRRCREAVVSNGDWVDGLDQIAWAVGTGGCSFVSRGTPEVRARMPASSRYGDFVKDFVAEGWAIDDLRAKRGWALFTRPGTVLLETDISTEEERQTLPLYRDLHARHDLHWWASVSIDVRTDMWAMSFLRPKADGPFTSEDADRLRALSPHLTELVDLQKANAKARAALAVQLMELMSSAALVISDGFEIVAVGDAALRLLRQEKLLRPDGRLSRALCTSLAESGDGPVAIPRRAQRPLLVEKIELPQGQATGVVGNRTLLLIRDLDQGFVMNPALLRETFKLSSAEARLAAALVQGDTLNTSAERMGVSVATVRNQLRSIFLKTDTNRQPDLISLLLRILH